METLKSIAEENKKKILSALYTGPKRWRELLEITGLSKKALAKHLKKLIEEGYITEKIDPKDRRVKIYELSDRGLEASKENIISLGLSIKLIKRFDPKWIRELNDEFLKLYMYTLGMLTFIGVYFEGECLKIIKKTLDNLSQIINEKEYFKTLREIYNDQEAKEILTKIRHFISQEISNNLLPFLVPTPEEHLKEIEKSLSDLMDENMRVITLDSEIVNFLTNITKEEQDTIKDDSKKRE